jgi:hypothetical protein
LSGTERHLANPAFAREAQHFLDLLDDVNLMQRLLLEETDRLRAMVRDLGGYPGHPADPGADFRLQDGQGGSA